MLRAIRVFTVTSLVPIVGMSVGAFAQAPASPTKTTSGQIKQQTLAGIDKLQTWYTRSTGLYQTTGWWNSANVLTMLADYSLAAHSKSYNSIFANSFQQAQKQN